MILGFLGKGGSGKSSVSTQMALFLNQEGKTVLAIDADHNMDLSYNLTAGGVPQVPYISKSLETFRSAIGLEEGDKSSSAFLSGIDKRFSLTPLSDEISAYSTLLKNDIRLMIAGEQTDAVLYGQSCSHTLTTPLKILLPLLALQPNEVVLVDEKAGADGVSTGIVTGIDVGVIVCEPSLHSIKTAKQIAELMDFYSTPYMCVANKVMSNEDKDFIVSQLGKEPRIFLKESISIKQNPSVPVDEWSEELGALLAEVKLLNQSNRLERTVEKFARNRLFAEA